VPEGWNRCKIAESGRRARAERTGGAELERGLLCLLVDELERKTIKSWNVYGH
jgi:hypothetical protein